MYSYSYTGAIYYRETINLYKIETPKEASTSFWGNLVLNLNLPALNWTNEISYEERKRILYTNNCDDITRLSPTKQGVQFSSGKYDISQNFNTQAAAETAVDCYDTEFWIFLTKLNIL